MRPQLGPTLHWGSLALAGEEGKSITQGVEGWKVLGEREGPLTFEPTAGLTLYQGS